MKGKRREASAFAGAAGRRPVWPFVVRRALLVRRVVRSVAWRRVKQRCVGEVDEIESRSSFQPIDVLAPHAHKLARPLQTLHEPVKRSRRLILAFLPLASFPRRLPQLRHEPKVLASGFGMEKRRVREEVLGRLRRTGSRRRTMRRRERRSGGRGGVDAAKAAKVLSNGSASVVPS